MKSFRIQKMDYGSRVQKLHLVILLILAVLVIWGVSSYQPRRHTSFVFHQGTLPAASRKFSIWSERRTFDGLNEIKSCGEWHLQVGKHFYIFGIGVREGW